MPPFLNAHALVVGIADYQHINKLPPVRDAQDVARLLIDPGQCGYPPDNVRLLQDGQATQAALRDELGRLARNSNADSTVFVYFSGHGGRLESGPNAGQYLLPVDVVYPTDESLARTALSGAEFTAALNAIPARKVLVVFDCCHSAGVGQPKDPAQPAFKSGLPESYYVALQAGRGRVVLASSRSTEYSYVLPGASYGLFTEHFLSGLRGGVPSDDGLIRVFDLFEYLQPRVTAAQPRQHPVFKAEMEENFPVALYLGGKKGVVPRDEQGYRYDAFISYVDKEPAASWVWKTLLPRLQAAGLRVAFEPDPGEEQVAASERLIRESKRTVVVLSDAYLTDNLTHFENGIATWIGVQEGKYRLLPVKIEEVDGRRLPLRLSGLVTLNLAHPQRADHEFDRLVRALQAPAPGR